MKSGKVFTFEGFDPATDNLIELDPIPASTSLKASSPQFPPDNSFEIVNLFVKKIDKSWGLKDLLDAFKSYGPIKSAKISLNPETHTSRGYGFVWFESPQDTAKVLEDASNNLLPF